MSATVAAKPTVKPNAPYAVRVLRFPVVREPDGAPRPMLGDPEAVAALAKQLVPDDDREHFWVLLLDSQNRLKAAHEVSVGSLNVSIVHPREVFRAAILGGAANLILVHNHPSGDPTPSKEDVQLTRQLVEGANILGLRIHDHVVISHAALPGKPGHASLAQLGLL